MNRRRALQLLGASTAAMASPAFASRNDGWRQLFNGNDLSNWSFYHDGVGNRDRHNAAVVNDGVLHFLGPTYSGPERTMGHIATLAEFENYHLRLQFKWGLRRFSPRTLQRRNSGILYHMSPETGRLFPNAVEFQVEEGDVGDAVMINTQALQGPLLGGTPLWPNWIPSMPRDYQTPVVAGAIARQWHRHSGNYESLNDWNTLDLYAFNDQAAHLVNGRIVNTLFSIMTPSAHGAATPLTRGRIALEFEAAEVMFRDVMLRELSAADIEALRRG